MEEIRKINVDGVDYDIVGKELTKVTYAELKALRDNGQLSEGHLYRITDYVTTTTQFETKSAGNVFDVIVLAVSANELSHIARAIQHEGDTYFDGNDLGAWELWYDLDNDTEKYMWADTTNGKGVIYRMIDEKRNDCPYDFKNILFYTTNFTNNTTSDKYYYTFSYVVSGKLYDGTVEKQVLYCYGNSMGVYIYTKKKRLNNNMFRNVYINNKCHSNTFGQDCYNNAFGHSCQSNTFGNYCYNNAFGQECRNNAFGSYCQSNTFGNYCYNNTFGHSCQSNTFGNSCQSNTFGNSLYNRHFDSNKATITLNDEYYDDGSGQLVPIKHPDLSTQPSILPYKFMGQYVYEQLIPLTEKEVLNLTTTGEFTMYCNTAERFINFAADYPVFIEATIMAWGVAHPEIGKEACPVFTPVVIDQPHTYSHRLYDFDVHYTQLSLSAGMQMLAHAYLRIVYTSKPEEGGGYYGYNSY